MTRPIGFVGLGQMGGPMSRRLRAAGYRLVVHDVRAEAVDALVAEGAEAAASPAEVAARAEVVLGSLPTPQVVREVALGPHGLIHGNAIRTYVDLSTTGQAVAVEVAAALSERGIVTLDAPVSGGVPGAMAGTLAVMVAGPAAELERMRGPLEVFGRVFHVGARPGLGQLMKLANNYLSATAIVATAEAIVLGVKGGLDPATMLDVINASTGRNTASEDKFPRQVLTGRYGAGFTTGLLTKDLGLCAAAAQALGVPMPVAAEVHDEWQQQALLVDRPALGALEGLEEPRLLVHERLRARHPGRAELPERQLLAVDRARAEIAVAATPTMDAAVRLEGDGRGRGVDHRAAHDRLGPSRRAGELRRSGLVRGLASGARHQDPESDCRHLEPRRPGHVSSFSDARAIHMSGRLSPRPRC
jgi:3-hydroxyisobutyrate dehydrogenase-like beta-hydroxyacid dehydrogenase